MKGFCISMAVVAVCAAGFAAVGPSLALEASHPAIPAPRDKPVPEPAPQPAPPRPLVGHGQPDIPPPSKVEFIISGAETEVAAAERLVVERGGKVLRHHLPGRLGIAFSVVDPGTGRWLSSLRAALSRAGLNVSVDRNATYRQAGEPVSYAAGMEGVDPAAGCRLGRPIGIGLVDGPVDAANPALQGVQVDSQSVLPPEDVPGSPDHATAIAALIAAPGQSGVPPGFAIGAHIFAAGAFAREGDRDVARVETIAMAIDWFAENKVTLVNMSLTGPFNQVLAQVLAGAAAEGMTIFAAVGNDRRTTVAYPAADPHVVAVTAVDANGALYRQANTGDKVDFAAPGVDLLVAGRSGAIYRSGTSYATAIVTALAAQLAAHGGNKAPVGIVDTLRNGARDLGAPGHDPDFGWGLVQSGGC